MAEHNGSQRKGDDHDEAFEDEDFDPKEYDAMMHLERLESLEEDMIDLGVSTLDEVRRRIRELHEQLGDDN